MKQAELILKEGNEGYALRDVIDNLSDIEILECMIRYARLQIEKDRERQKEKWIIEDNFHPLAKELIPVIVSAIDNTPIQLD